MRWQKWAIYRRFRDKADFQYSLEDFIFQNLLKDLEKRSVDSLKSGDHYKAALWEAVAAKHKLAGEIEVAGVMKAYYSAFNRRSFEDLKVLWQPSEDVELTLPGYPTAVNINNFIYFIFYYFIYFLHIILNFFTLILQNIII